MKEKGKNVKLRMVDCQKPGPLKINSKQSLRDAVTDFIIHDMSGINNYTRKIKNKKYEPITFRLQVNNRIQTFTIQLQMLLIKYTSQAKNQIQNGVGIQDLTNDILEFIEKLDDQVILISLQAQGEVNPEKIVSILAERHFREKRRELLQDQYNAVRKALCTKYKKVLFNQSKQRDKNQREYPGQKNSQENSQRVSRSTITALIQKEQYGKKHLQVPTKSRLKALVDSCNVFDSADRVQALRREKLITQFCGGKQSEFIAVRQEVKKHYPCASSSSLTVETMQQLEDWINDISVSEALFKKKYEPQAQSKQSKRQAEESSSSDDDLS